MIIINYERNVKKEFLFLTDKPASRKRNKKRIKSYFALLFHLNLIPIPFSFIFFTMSKDVLKRVTIWKFGFPVVNHSYLSQSPHVYSTGSPICFSRLDMFTGL